MGHPKIQKPADSEVPSPVEVPSDYLLAELEGNKYVDAKIKEMVKGFILGDKDIDKEIEKVVDKIEKDKIKVFFTKLGFGAWSLLMLVIGALLPVVIDAIRHK